MSFFHIFIQGLLLIMILMSVLWILSIILKNVSIVDLFWGLGFVLTAGFYFLKTEGSHPRKIILIPLCQSGVFAYRYISPGGILEKEKISGTKNSGRITVKKDIGG